MTVIPSEPEPVELDRAAVDLAVDGDVDHDVDGDVDIDDDFDGDFDADDFDEHDFEEVTDDEDDDHGPVPVVAVVGRPNVGKSTLVNRIIGRRQAVVEDVPGVTRDRVAYDALWSGQRFLIVDTGGWIPDAKERAKAIAAQAEAAVHTADVVLFVVDATVGALDDDEAAVRMLRRGGKPVVLVANKVDNARQEIEASSLWSLGLGEPHPVSALHGRGSGDLLDAVLAALPEKASGVPKPRGPRRVALVGRPNVGKSSLLNRLAKEERAVVDAVAGTTVDPVDSLVSIGGEIWQLVDTAGLRKRVGQASGTEYYASLRTNAAIEAAEVAVVLLDASEPISEQDQRIITMVADAGRALIIAFNKWDLVDSDRRQQIAREIERDLRRVPWALRINVSARTGRAVEKLAPVLRTALDNWSRRVPTGRLNQWLTALVQATPHPVRSGKSARVLFATQAASSPPRFVLFTTGPLDAGYVRFVERRLREEFDFAGTPVHVSVRPRKKQGRTR
ncbi:MAG: GTPase [Micromonosporaceae bacterium]|nr:GTPase [Micromonosporaceae bacterium]